MDYSMIFCNTFEYTYKNVTFTLPYIECELYKKRNYTNLNIMFNYSFDDTIDIIDIINYIKVLT